MKQKTLRGSPSLMAIRTRLVQLEQTVNQIVQGQENVSTQIRLFERTLATMDLFGSQIFLPDRYWILNVKHEGAQFKKMYTAYVENENTTHLRILDAKGLTRHIPKKDILETTRITESEYNERKNSINEAQQ